MKTVVSDCGVLLGVQHGYAFPLTGCCQVPATPARTCSVCWAQVPQAFEYAAIIGHRHMIRDLQSIVIGIGECGEPQACAKRLAEALDHTRAMRIGWVS